MSVVYQCDKYFLINHAKFINKLYIHVSDGRQDSAYELVHTLFSIQNNKNTGNKKRSHSSDKLQTEVSAILTLKLTHINVKISRLIYTYYTLSFLNLK